jgi:hypothetical protein
MLKLASAITLFVLVGDIAIAGVSRTPGTTFCLRGVTYRVSEARESRISGHYYQGGRPQRGTVLPRTIEYTTIRRSYSRQYQFRAK